MEREKGIVLYKDILHNKALNSSEKIVLSIYKYFTKNGRYKCCSMTNEEVSQELEISIVQLKRIKKHLKELGLIKTSGIKVYYNEGYQDDTTRGINMIPPQYQDDTSKGIKMIPHNNNEESIDPPYKGSIDSNNNKENESSVGLIEETNLDSLSNEENKPKTNWDLVLDNLTDYYKTTEKIEYLKTTSNGIIDKINSIPREEFNAYNTCNVIRDKLIEKFNVEPYEAKDIEKKEPTGHFLY